MVFNENVQKTNEISCVVAPSGGPQGHNSLHDCTGRGHIGWKRGEVVPETIYTTPSRCMQTPCTSHTTYTTYTAGTALTVAHAPHSKLLVWGAAGGLGGWWWWWWWWGKVRRPRQAAGVPNQIVPVGDGQAVVDADGTCVTLVTLIDLFLFRGTGIIFKPYV